LECFRCGVNISNVTEKLKGKPINSVEELLSLECLCDECEKRPPTPIKKRKKKPIGQNKKQTDKDVEEKENSPKNILNVEIPSKQQPETKEKKTFECDLCCKHYEANSFGMDDEKIKKKEHLVCDNCYPYLNVKKIIKLKPTRTKKKTSTAFAAKTKVLE
jgi:hypothetical protein